MTTILSDLRVKLNLTTQKPTPTQYRSSVGDAIQLNPSLGFGRQAWEAIERAKDVWHDNVERCIDAIQLHHYPEIFKGLTPPTISRRCWMVGPSKDFAHPTAVITCERKTVLRRLVRLISRDQLFRSTDFRIITIISSLEVLHSTAYLRINPNAWTSTLSLPGAEVYLTHLNRRATLGGVILVGNELYGLTVAHVCTGEEFPQASNGIEQGKTTFYDELDFEVTEFDSDGDSGSISDYDDTQHQELPGTDGTTPDYSDASNIGTQSFGVYVPTGFWSSTHPLQPGLENEYDGCDWALSTLPINRPKVNEVSFPSTLEQNQQHLFVNRIIPDDLLNPEDASRGNREPIQLWVVTRRGPIKAYSKAGSSTSVSFVNSHTFQKFWTIQLSEMLKPGDSGSWVIDANTGDLYGVLISQLELLEEGYVIQATDILQDIRVKLTANTRLPTTDDALSEAIKYGDMSLMKRLIIVAVEQKSLSDNTATIALGALVNNLPLSSWDDHLPLFSLLQNNGADTGDVDTLHAVSRMLRGFESDFKATRDHEKPSFLDALLFLLTHRKSSDEPPLSWAICQRHQRIAQLFLEFGDVEVDLNDNRGRTPLSWAAEKGQETIVRLLLERDSIEVDFKDKDGQTPLLYAAAQGIETVVRQLLEHSARSDLEDNDGRSPLSWAAENGEESVVQLLLERDVRVDLADNDGRTPLSWAAENGEQGVVQLLLQHKDINVNSKDKNGHTPLWWAKECDIGGLGIVDMIKAHGGRDDNTEGEEEEELGAQSRTWMDWVLSYIGFQQ